MELWIFLSADEFKHFTGFDKFIRNSRFARNCWTIWLLLPLRHRSWESDKKIKIRLHNTNPPQLLPQLLLQPQCLKRKGGTSLEHHASSSMHSSLFKLLLKHSLLEFFAWFILNKKTWQGNPKLWILVRAIKFFY